MPGAFPGGAQCRIPLKIKRIFNYPADIWEYPNVREVEFKKLAIGPGGEAAARALFEQLVIDLVGGLHPGCRTVRANPGDWGIDAYVGQLEPGGKVDIWQAKFFTSEVGKVQQKQIRDAYNQALKAARSHGHEVGSWTLCLPCALSGPETKWWNGWQRRQDDSVDIDLWPAEHLRRMILSPEAAWIYDSYFSDDPADRPKRRIFDLADDAKYEHALFIRQMLEAEVRGAAALSDAKRAYFNAELVEADVINRESVRQREELEEVRIENHALWNTEFIAASVDEKTQPATTYAAVFSSLRAHHAHAPSGSLRLHFVHRDGVMHQLVNDGSAGWLRNYERIAREHAS